ncbi:MAG: peptidoglycan editing factor PgeF [Oceanospirillaceae bacterium]|nr:peptidoglycan editing factor PgeF [Oceanospirillaceae bacterium]MBT4442397.1 peptidoglycan editing factor PgeF [Oceanospirillaceae bacterium]MBT6078240.1 peptidoglycan editing factor PgeF [Oceanospirillaceae bacterium]MBT7330238.1 peptidoglycan editing factor PgeF [Oceanospirillaceae bacterium]
MNDQGQCSRYLQPDWPAPANVHAASTCRDLAANEPAVGLAGFNLARHVGDDPARVARHRLQLQQDLGLERSPFWLNQTHSTNLLKLPAPAGLYDCDGSTTQTRNWPCVVMTADCLPVLLCDTGGTQVAAVHAGWQGLANGIVAKAIGQFDEPSQVMAWLGPAIGPTAFEVGVDVLHAFGVDPSAASTEFTPKSVNPNKWFGNLYAIARAQLNQLGVTQIYGGHHCTLSDPQHFYSHRRDAASGRMASMIWLG